MNGRDLYVKITSTKPGASPVYRQLRAWDSDKLYASVVDQHSKEDNPANVVKITQEEFRDNTWKKK